MLDDVPLDDLVPYIDWTFFFAAWELKGRFPAILDHPQYGPAARELYENARALLDRIIDERLLTRERRLRVLARRQRGRRHRRLRRPPSDRRAGAVQHAAAAGGRCRREAEPVAGRLHRRSHGAGRDYIGAFAVTAGIGADDLARQFERSTRRLQRDYGEGARRSTGRGVRGVSARHGPRANGAYAERTTPDDILAERHRGIRPGFGYPACPDHSEKFKLFDLLDAREPRHRPDRARGDDAGRQRQRAVLRHPQARYFTVGRLGRGSDRQLRAPQGAVDRAKSNDG